MAPLTVPKRTEPWVGVVVSLGCCITSEPEAETTSLSLRTGKTVKDCKITAHSFGPPVAFVAVTVPCLKTLTNSPR